MKNGRKHLLRTVGTINILFFILHLAFWHLFGWPKSLHSLSTDNRIIMQILNIHIAYTILFFGILCLFFTRQLLSSVLGKFCVLIIGGFWLLRGIDGIYYWGCGVNGMTFISIFCMLVAGLCFICIPKRP